MITFQAQIVRNPLEDEAKPKGQISAAQAIALKSMGCEGFNAEQQARILEYIGTNAIKKLQGAFQRLLDEASGKTAAKGKTAEIGGVQISLSSLNALGKAWEADGGLQEMLSPMKSALQEELLRQRQPAPEPIAKEPGVEVVKPAGYTGFAPEKKAPAKAARGGISFGPKRPLYQDEFIGLDDGKIAMMLGGGNGTSLVARSTDADELGVMDLSLVKAQRRELMGMIRGGKSPDEIAGKIEEFDSEYGKKFSMTGDYFELAIKYAMLSTGDKKVVSKILELSEEYPEGGRGVARAALTLPQEVVGKFPQLAGWKEHQMHKAGWLSKEDAKAEISKMPKVAGQAGQERINAIFKDLQTSIKHNPQEGDPASPRIALEKGEEDCDGKALLLSNLLEAEGVARENMTMVLFSPKDGKPGHAFLLVENPDGTFASYDFGSSGARIFAKKPTEKELVGLMHMTYEDNQMGKPDGQMKYLQASEYFQEIMEKGQYR